MAITKRKRSGQKVAAADLASFRDRIDGIDAQVLDLLNERAGLALEVGAVKQRLAAPMYSPSRERELLDQLVQSNQGPLPEDSLRLIYQEIISASLALERPLEVAYLGPLATFTHEATKRHFGSSARLLPRSSISEVFDDVERGRCQYGVVPIENSTEGVVNHTLDMFMDSDLSICAEILLLVSHHLLTVNGSLSGLRTVASHPQALAQCRGWLEKNLAGVEQRDVASTARAAQMAKGDPEVGAVASELASSLYELQVAARNVQDVRDNMTRFLVIGTDPPEPTGADRTSIMFALKDGPGVLFQALKAFADREINLSRIESRPSRRRAWDYMFFIDLVGHLSEKPVTGAVETLREACAYTKVLGSYPRGKVSKGKAANKR